MEFVKDSDLHKTLGEIKVRMGLTSYQLALMCGVSYSHMRNLLNGTHIPTRELLIKLGFISGAQWTGVCKLKKPKVERSTRESK